jgi:hypothetical protein
MVNERKLSKAELSKREDIIMNMKDNKRDLVKKYGKDAEAVMYGRATNMAKKQTKEMRDPKLTELIKDALKNPKKADLNKDGKLSDYEKKRGSAIEKNISEDLDLGHEDNEPHMLKSDLYHIGKCAMNLYNTLDQFDDAGEVDLPSWWQSKIFKAKEALVGAEQYLDFELNEPKIDAVVDVAVDVVDETVEDFITSVDDLSETNITESMNMDKWRRAYNGKAFAKKVVYLEDYTGNKKRYVILFKYKETPSKDIVYLMESHMGKHEGSGMPFAISNLQNKPAYLFTSDDKMEFDTEEQFDDFVDDGAKGLESLLSFFLGGKNVDSAIKAWFDTGVTDKSKMRIGPAEYFEGAKVDESISKYSSLAEKLAKELKESVNEGMSKEALYSQIRDIIDSLDSGESDGEPLTNETEMLLQQELQRLRKIYKSLKEGLPKGFWDKKIDAEDEDQDGKIDEDLKGLMAQGEKIAAFANKQSGYEGGVSSPVRGVLAAATVAGAPDFNGDEDLKAYWTRRLTKAIETQKGKKYMSGFSVDESYATVVNKIKKSGKSEKAAKAIAGAVASYKAKGGGKGPTAKQK